MAIFLKCRPIAISCTFAIFLKDSIITYHAECCITQCRHHAITNRYQHNCWYRNNIVMISDKRNSNCDRCQTGVTWHNFCARFGSRRPLFLHHHSVVCLILQKRSLRLLSELRQLYFGIWTVHTSVLWSWAICVVCRRMASIVRKIICTSRAPQPVAPYK